MTPSQFRQDFPEFASTTDYQDAQVSFWIGQAARLLPADRWEDSLDLGTELFTAHHLAIGRRDQIAAQAGGIPGMVSGPQSSKTVDKVSVSNDASLVSLADAGYWNATSYGIRFLQMARYVGAGGVQL